MPSPNLTSVSLNKFSGLNTMDSPGNIADTELLECQNYAIGRDGELVKRTGIKNLHDFGAAPVTLIGHFQTDTYNHVIVRVGNQIYWTEDLVTWNLIAGGPFNNVEWGVQYANNFYMVRRDATMLRWTGAVLSSLANTPQGTIACVYRDRLFVANTFSSNPTRVYYSEVADFTDFAGLGQFVDINQGDGDPIVSLVVLQNNLVIFKSASIWHLRTSPDLGAWSVDNVNAKIGCISKHSIKEIKGFLIFLADSGVYRTDLVSFTELSASVRPIFHRQVNALVGINESSAGFWEDKYILLLQTFANAVTWSFLSTKTWGSLKKTTWGSQNATYVWMVLNLKTGGWTHWFLAEEELMNCHTFLEIYGPITLRSLLVGSRVNDGILYQHGEGIYYDGVNSPYECIIETKDFDFDSPLVKRGRRLFIDRQGRGIFGLNYVIDQEQEELITPPWSDSTLGPVWSDWEIGTWGDLALNKTKWGEGIFFPTKREIQPTVAPGFFTTLRVRVSNFSKEPEIFYGFKLEMIPKAKVRKGK